MRILPIVLLGAGFCSAVLWSFPENAGTRFVDPTVSFTTDPSATRSSLIADGAPSVTVGSVEYFWGTEFVGGSFQQDPLLFKFDGGSLEWVKRLEGSNVDSEIVGVLVTKNPEEAERLFVAVETEGNAVEYTAASNRGWIRSITFATAANYGVILELDPTTGDLERGTYLHGRLSSGAASTARVRDFYRNGPDVVVILDAAFSPIRTDETRMTYTGTEGSPFVWAVVLTDNLEVALASAAQSHDGVGDDDGITPPWMVTTQTNTIFAEKGSGPFFGTGIAFLQDQEEGVSLTYVGGPRFGTGSFVFGGSVASFTLDFPNQGKDFLDISATDSTGLIGRYRRLLVTICADELTAMEAELAIVLTAFLESGLRYQLQSSDDGVSWTNDGEPVDGMDAEMVFSRPRGMERMFYRLIPY